MISMAVIQWKRIPASAVEAGGRFIVFEGIDGSGKSTQAKLLRDLLTGLGWQLLLTAEPSDGPVGTTLRSLKTRLAPQEEAQLFTEDRAYHVEHVILPALSEGRIVICDRYVYSTVAYQAARGVDPKSIITANEAFAVAPDVIFLLEVPVEHAFERVSSDRGEAVTPFEARENLERVNSIYARLNDPLLVRIDAAGSVEHVHATIVDALAKRSGFEEIGLRGGRGG
jgi:dTMP kinase